MPELVRLKLNDREIHAPAGTTVATAITNAGVTHTRRSVAGEARGPLCGMGVCCECRATINGQPHQRTCNLLVAEGMEVTTDA
ncbi:MAG: (2Fe-2S)-binding protein [Tepidisphaeraceae bacterium]|jgi:sarcosine oxidase subunit alpha